MSGHGRTGQLLSPIRIIVRMPEPENLKVEDLSKSVNQALRSEQATSHGMHCRQILFTPRCSPRAREFPGFGRLFCVTYGCGATGRQTCPIFGFLPRDAMHKRDICRHAVSICLSVCLSVCPSVTFVSCAKTNKDIFEIFSPSGSHTILVFPYQTEWRYYNGNPPN